MGLDVTIVTEAYNLAEGQGYDELDVATRTVLQLIGANPDREGIVLTPSSDPRVDALATDRHPRLRLLRGPDLGYDALKNLAAFEARGQYIVYLDGDCVPAREDWLECLLRPLRNGETDVSAGLTIYSGSDVLTAACSVLDFGFLVDGQGESLGCYASNNVAFPTALRQSIPPLHAGMRCSCYQHAQALLHHGYRIRCAFDALTTHQLPPLRAERHRRGYDLVSACWMNPNLPETAWIEPTEACVSRLIEQNLRLDRKRLAILAEILDWTPAFMAKVDELLPRLRRLDAIGTRRALRDGEENGATAAARAVCMTD